MTTDDASLSVVALHAAINDSEIPLSEFIRKEFYYKSYMSFSTAIGAEPSLIADEVRKHCRRFDLLYGTVFQHTKREREKEMRFTQGDYRRFCATFYWLTRKMLQTCEMLVIREGKKRIMPRHLMNSAIATGIIPYDVY